MKGVRAWPLRDYLHVYGLSLSHFDFVTVHLRPIVGCDQDRGEEFRGGEVVSGTAAVHEVQPVRNSTTEAKRLWRERIVCHHNLHRLRSLPIGRRSRLGHRGAGEGQTEQGG